MSPQEPGGRTGGETGVSVMVGNRIILIEGEVANQKDGKSNVRVDSWISGLELSNRLDTSGSNSMSGQTFVVELALSV